MAIVNFDKRVTSGVGEAALTTDVSGRLVNFGKLVTTGDLADGIFVDADDVSIANSGPIRTHGLGASAIHVRGSDGQVVNYGSLRTEGGVFDPDPDLADDEVFSEGVFVDGDRFRIANHGNVRVDGEAASALIGSGEDGLIANAGRIVSHSDGGLVLAVLGAGSRIVNAGRVLAAGANTDVLHAQGAGAAALNVGEVVVAGPNIGGVVGVETDTHLTNQGSIRVAADGGSFGMGAFGDDHLLANFGSITVRGALAMAMEAVGGGVYAGQDLRIVNAGRVDTRGELAAGIGLGFAGFGGGFHEAVDGSIRNRGVIRSAGDGAAGLVVAGDGHHVSNSGRIISNGGVYAGDAIDGELSAAAVLVSGDGAIVRNARAGMMQSRSADSAAVELNVVTRSGLANADTSARLDNLGLIKGTATAVLGGAGAETVVNRGVIKGDVALGDGADVFVAGRGGKLAGHLLLGGGDDLVALESGSGRTRVADFAAGDSGGDVIDVSAFFSSLAQLQAHGTQHGSDAVISLDRKSSLVMENVQLDALTASDFRFA